MMSDQRHGRVSLTFIGVGLVIFGSRLWLIHNYGSSVPFWDEWNGYLGRSWFRSRRANFSSPTAISAA
jgi:hypothetical protein